METFSLIMPVLNEYNNLRLQLPALQAWRAAGHELLVVDGGSSDDSVAIAREHADIVIESRSGRARQMNAGAQRASGDVLLFLHADTRLPPGAERSVPRALADSHCHWGRFDVQLDGEQPMFRVIERMMNLRSRLTSVATGDQAIFVRRASFIAAGGFPDIPLMEDVALSKTLRRISRPLNLQQTVITSSRRWQQHGIVKTLLLMWWLRLLYVLGVSPRRLHQRYYGKSG